MTRKKLIKNKSDTYLYVCKTMRSLGPPLNIRCSILIYTDLYILTYTDVRKMSHSHLLIFGGERKMFVYKFLGEQRVRLVDVMFQIVY